MASRGGFVAGGGGDVEEVFGEGSHLFGRWWARGGGGHGFLGGLPSVLVVLLWLWLFGVRVVGARLLIPAALLLAATPTLLRLTDAVGAGIALIFALALGLCLLQYYI